MIDYNLYQLLNYCISQSLVQKREIILGVLSRKEFNIGDYEVIKILEEVGGMEVREFFLIFGFCLFYCYCN